MRDNRTSLAAGLRGLPEQPMHEQIVAAANEHFRLYGYGKTTLADLAKAIGFSKAYIYKFFESKQAIGEVICGNCLSAVIDEVQLSIEEGRSGSDKLRRMFKTITATSAALFFKDRKLYDIAVHSSSENWKSSVIYAQRVEEILVNILREGRDAGEFERKTPLDEISRAILQVMQPFTDPRMLQHNLDLIPDGPNEVVNLVLRSLAP